MPIIHNENIIHTPNLWFLRRKVKLRVSPNKKMYCSTETFNDFKKKKKHCIKKCIFTQMIVKYIERERIWSRKIYRYAVFQGLSTY